jgi:hypothetical protein
VSGTQWHTADMDTGAVMSMSASHTAYLVCRILHVAVECTALSPSCMTCLHAACLCLIHVCSACMLLCTPPPPPPPVALNRHAPSSAVLETAVKMAHLLRPARSAGEGAKGAWPTHSRGQDSLLTLKLVAHRRISTQSLEANLFMPLLRLLVRGLVTLPLSIGHQASVMRTHTLHPPAIHSFILHLWQKLI